MPRTFLIISFISLTLSSLSQNRSFEIFLADSSMLHASVSFCAADADNSIITSEYNSLKSLVPASVMKLITSAAALELLGPEYTFKTTLGYSGSLNKKSGKLTGNIVIKGGGDPTLGSKNFEGYNIDFVQDWISEIRKQGISKIDGEVVTDDSYFDYQPVPQKWLWEDEGNYYGAGVYGLSVYDNTYEIHLKTSSDSSKPVITGIFPDECRYDIKNLLFAYGTIEKGYVFSSPYSNTAWLSGYVPAGKEDYILKASVPDPPLMMARILDNELRSGGVKIKHDPASARLQPDYTATEFKPLVKTVSPPLSEIIEVLNHESINLYAEHLTKELGRKYKGNGSTAAGIEVIKEFLQSAEIKTDGFNMEDGSGLSPSNSINSRTLVDLLIYMRKKGKYFPEFFASLPDAGTEGTLKTYFTDQVFTSRLWAKSGSMTRVRSYAGYFTTASGKNMVFSIIVNNFDGPSKNIVSGIEGILKEIILTN
jgi:serine-type D-Ala-D-Ala carboxypeptidase/endopeptidase (penicillin-binding protein 4)